MVMQGQKAFLAVVGVSVASDPAMARSTMDRLLEMEVPVAAPPAPALPAMSDKLPYYPRSE